MTPRFASRPSRDSRSASTASSSRLRCLLGSLGIAALACTVAPEAQGAAFIISETTTLFTPTFRDLTGTDQNNTTWYGWTGNNDGVTPSPDDGGFDGSTNNELIDSPAVIIGTGGINGTLNQVGTADLLATSNNIFAGDLTNNSVEAHLTLQIVTNGVVGLDGYTTIIIQGLGAVTGGGTQAPFVPGAINGISPQYVSGPNAQSGRVQWWAKYQIPGNATQYLVDILIPGGTGINPGSLRELVVDTQYSTTAYGDDYALVPEPSSIAALLGGVSLLSLIRRRRAVR